MAIKIGHASIDENGKAIGGKAGDQTKKEVCTRDSYSNNWDYVLRAKDPKIAEQSAVFVEDVCANDNVGYDQGCRNTLYKEAKAVGFDGLKIKVKCEADCSSLMHTAAIAGGAKVEYGSNGATTRTLDSTLYNGGKGPYEILKDKKYTRSYDYAERGDIYVKEGSHTVMALEDGPKVAKKKEEVPSNDTYYPKYTGKSSKINDVLKAVGVPAEYRGEWEKRVPVAEANGIVNYTGTFSQNIALITRAKQGKLKVVVEKTKWDYYPKYTGKSTAIDEVFKAIGVPSEYIKDRSGEGYAERTPVAKANGISSYKGTASQNSKLVSLAKQGKLKRVK